MYAQKYDEEFSSHLPGFVTTVWNLLITTGSHVKYDQVSCKAIVLVITNTLYKNLPVPSLCRLYSILLFWKLANELWCCCIR